MALKLVTESDSPQAFKALVAARYAGVNLEVVAPTDKNRGLLGKLPVLQVAEGNLFEANAVARYVARQGKNNLFGSSAFEAAQVDQWVDFATNEIDLPASVIVFPLLGLINNNVPAVEKALSDVKKVLDALNKHFLTKTFLVGERVTLADVAVASSLFQLYQKYLDADTRKAFTNTNRWFLTVVNQPEFKAVAGEFKLCEKRETPKEVVKKEAPKKEQAAPKKEAPKKKDEEEEDFDEDKEDKKKKNPLDDLPPSSFNMDEWKRTYSNSDTRTVAIPYFWKNFDANGYSLWFGDYKYNDENTQVFKTANLLGGFIQRLDKLRKYGFANMVIFGEEPKLEVGTCFLVRGTTPPPELSECDDYEHYNWRKVNVEDEKDRELVNDYFAWDGSFGGKKFNQAKTFK